MRNKPLHALDATGLWHEFNDAPKVCQALDQVVFLPFLVTGIEMVRAEDLI
jgi:hypothetical protein